MGRTVSTCALGLLAALLWSLCVVTSGVATPEKDLRAAQQKVDPSLPHREGRFFLPFFIIRVPEVACNGTNGEEGTCYSTNDCNDKGGAGSGSCAGGYGVCCIFEKACGDATSRNNTFLVNDGYPQTYSSVSNCYYGIEKMNDNICQVRLDFETLSLAPPETTNGECDVDTFTVTTSSSYNPPVVCGLLTGKHMYIEVPSSTSTVRVNIATGNNGFDRNWRIKATQIACDSKYRAPANCLQYYTEPTGTIMSFNYVDTATTTQQLADQDYSICIKVQEGFCSIEYTESDTDSFSLTGDAGTPAAVVGSANCGEDYLGFFTPASDRFCGSQFDTIESSTRPFIVHVKTDSTEPTADVNNKGFSLDYSQNPC